MLIIATFTPLDLLKVCILYTDAALLICSYEVELAIHFDSRTGYLQWFLYFEKSLCSHVHITFSKNISMIEGLKKKLDSGIAEWISEHTCNNK